MEILTAKRDDHGGRVFARHACDAVTLQTGAVDQEIATLFALVADEMPFTGRENKLLRLARKEEVGTLVTNHSFHGFHDLFIVHNALLGDVDGCNGCCHRFEFAQAFGADLFQPFQAVGRTAFQQRVEVP